MRRLVLPPSHKRQVRAASLVFATGAFFLLLGASILARSPEKGKKGKKSDELTFSSLRIEVKAGEEDRPVANASVYIRYEEPHGIFHRNKEVELDFKTNQDGSVKVPEVPRGKVLVQVVAPGWHTFGKQYVIEKEEELIEIKLQKPPRWY